MKVVLTTLFIADLDDQVAYIKKDKPLAAKKFRKELISNLKKDLVNPFHFKKSIYFNDDLVRDYVFKGYTCVFQINNILNTAEVFGLIKYKERL